MRLTQLHEGTCAQLLHHGSYDEEGPKLAELHGEYLAAQGPDSTVIITRSPSATPGAQRPPSSKPFCANL